MRLQSLKQHIIFIDETAAFLKSKDFAQLLRGSDNYFVIVTRDDLALLPYSVDEIYGLRNVSNSTKYKSFKKVYNEMYQVYNLGVMNTPKAITDETWEYADSSQYLSWEEFYTSYLTDSTRNGINQYSKKKLGEFYKTSGCVDKVCAVLPDQVKDCL